MRTSLLPALVLSAFFAACSTTPRAAEATAASGPNEGPGAGPRETGVVAPGEHTALSLWPEAYTGELLVLEAGAQGMPVAAGDVLARLDTRWIDEQIAAAELELGSARIQNEGLLERGRIAQEAADAQLARTRAGLERARRSLEGYEKHELAFARRIDELSAQRDQARLDDQGDELGQLEAMYNADELTDATEEIVLKRERRNLELVRASNGLSADRRVYDNEYERAMESEQRREAVQAKELELDHLVRTQATERAARDDAASRSAQALEKQEEQLGRLRRDRELFTIVAPHAGVLLHGEEADYRPGKSPTRLERASRVTPRADLLMVVQPGDLVVTLELAESALANFSDGSAVVVRAVADAEASVQGTLSVAAYPSGQKGSEATLEGRVALSGTPKGWLAGMYVTVEPAEAAAE